MALLINSVLCLIALFRGANVTESVSLQELMFGHLLIQSANYMAAVVQCLKSFKYKSFS